MKARTNKNAGAGRLGRLVRPFEVGESVYYQNHAAGYQIFPLEVLDIAGNIVTARNEECRTFTFRADTGRATWSPNLSIKHWPNV